MIHVCKMKVFWLNNSTTCEKKNTSFINMFSVSKIIHNTFHIVPHGKVNKSNKKSYKMVHWKQAKLAKSKTLSIT